MLTGGSGHMDKLFGAAFLSLVVLVDDPTVDGAESTTMPVVANVGL